MPIVSPNEITEAARRIAGYVRQTPVISIEGAELGLRGKFFLKLESLQHTGSFKPRGAFNRILSSAVPKSGVIAASGGNHGAAVAYAARQLGHAAEIFVPTIVSPVKVERLRKYGASVTITGSIYSETLAASNEKALRTGALAVHAYDEPEVIAGQGTLGMELEAHVPELDTLLVAVGGGGLIAGVAAWYQGRARVIGVEPFLAPTLFKALEAGRPLDVSVAGVAADSLGATRVGELVFPIAQRYVNRVLLVEDEQILRAQGILWDVLRLVAEPGGAAAFAALISGAHQPARDERVGVVICGGNADIRKLPA